MMIFPLKSGMSSAVHFGLGGGKKRGMKDGAFPMVSKILSGIPRRPRVKDTGFKKK
jgi:hypothetical protein